MLAQHDAMGFGISERAEDKTKPHLCQERIWEEGAEGHWTNLEGKTVFRFT